MLSSLNMSDTSLPTVTVIIPTYNRGHVIRRALHSVLHQTYQSLEVIVVDDGSTDNTEAIVESFNDPRILYIRHETKQGAATARNTGIKAASADFIAFQDSDDEWLCEKLERQMAIFRQAGAEVGVVYTGFVRLENNQASYCPPKDFRKSGNILESLLNGNFVTTQAAVVRKECFQKVGLFDEQLPRLQDWELFIRMAKRYEFICIDEIFLVVYHSTTSITADDSLFPVALKIILVKHQDDFEKYKNILVRHYHLLGRINCASGEMAKGLGCFVQSVRHDPFCLMCWVRLLIALPGSRFYRFSSNIIDKVRNA